MPKRTKRLRGLLSRRVEWQGAMVLCVLLTSLFSCRFNQDAEGLVRIRLRGEPESLHWVKTTDTNAFRLIPTILRPLIQWRPDRGFIPGVAQKWTQTGRETVFEWDGTQKWSDGSTVLAEDFKRALDFILNPRNASPTLSLFHGVLDSSGVEVLGETKLRIRTLQPVGFFLSLMTMLYPIHANESLESPFPKFVNGSFYVHRWERGKQIELARFSKEAPYPSRLQFLLVEEDATAVRLFETGQLDVVDFPQWSDFLRIQKSAPAQTRVFPTSRVIYLALRREHPLLSSVDFRRTLLRQVNREMLAKLRFPLWRKALWIVPEELFPETEPSLLQLKWPEFNQQTITKPVELTLVTSHREEERLIAEFLQEQVKPLGVRLKVWSMDWKAYLMERKKPSTALALASWNGSHPHPHTFLELFLKLPHLFVHSSNPHYEKWVNSVEKVDWIKAAQAVTVDEAVVLPLVRENLTLLIRPGITSPYVSPFSMIYYDSLQLN